MRTVYQAADLIDAHLMLHRLQDAGIEAQVLGGFLSGGIGELPMAGLIRVVVADQDTDAALNAVAAAQATEASAADADSSAAMLDDDGACSEAV
jgi:hypothetical protein